MSYLSFSGKEITFGNLHFTCPNNVIDAFENNGKIVILLDPDAYLSTTENDKNLIAYDTKANPLWEAEFPQIYKGDYYYKIASKNPLIVYSFSSYHCEIDINTGKIISSEFYK
ncbi:hypothetical protein FH593_13455 [Leptospira interrogans]|uniref:hypothetical protein n=1 Tax=Leptospira TaxID=171 RepID=UPI0002B9EDBF|nr:MULTISPECIES: hypothetical protein [Leptospira]MCL8312680.1 hypothetical protein [Leptospira interrogans]ULG85563.1 hypothetical protein FH594_07080 [Leptospira interrogans]ULG87581.1 hypothetical protein FH593_13455 [Leptospira interrogans]UML77706.1 hypothetical protein FH583_09365 [Leptospira interrogans]